MSEILITPNIEVRNRTNRNIDMKEWQGHVQIDLSTQEKPVIVTISPRVRKDGQRKT